MSNLTAARSPFIYWNDQKKNPEFFIQPNNLHALELLLLLFILTVYDQIKIK